MLFAYMTFNALNCGYLIPIYWTAQGQYSQILKQDIGMVTIEDSFHVFAGNFGFQF